MEVEFENLLALFPLPPYPLSPRTSSPLEKALDEMDLAPPNLLCATSSRGGAAGLGAILGSFFALMDLNPRDPVPADAGPKSSFASSHSSSSFFSSPNPPTLYANLPWEGGATCAAGAPTVTTLGDGGFTSRAGSASLGAWLKRESSTLTVSFLAPSPPVFLAPAAVATRRPVRMLLLPAGLAEGELAAATMGLGTICGFGAAGCGFGAAGAIGGAMSSKGSKKSSEVFPDAAVGLVTGLTTVFFAAASFASSCLYIAAARQVYFCAIWPLWLPLQPCCEK
mmetsp:Transcript_4210/g.17337  ORF Transcript_4210/g.17337 Transcript_4210/m.17337 type:complete len:281 (+) Transcript_4210:443-1285(+)